MVRGSERSSNPMDCIEGKSSILRIRESKYFQAILCWRLVAQLAIPFQIAGPLAPAGKAVCCIQAGGRAVWYLKCQFFVATSFILVVFTTSTGGLWCAAVNTAAALTPFHCAGGLPFPYRAVRCC